MERCMRVNFAEIVKDMMISLELQKSGSSTWALQQRYTTRSPSKMKEKGEERKAGNREGGASRNNTKPSETWPKVKQQNNISLQNLALPYNCNHVAGHKTDLGYPP